MAGDSSGERPATAKKRYSATSIMDFFHRKRPHGARVVVDEEDEAVAEAEAQGSAESTNTDAGAGVEAISSDDENEADEEFEAVETVVEGGKARLRGIRKKHSDDFSSVTRLLSRRELGECGGRAPHKYRNPRRRIPQLVSRWALGMFRCSPVKLTLSADWEQRAGRLRNEEFYASCVEFDSAGVLLAAGSSNGIIAIYDFDEYAHRSINAGHRMMQAKHDQPDDDLEIAEALERMHPIHTIFTPFEVQCIRWNPMNEDEIACSFSNRNEIWLFNLRKFPTRPTRVLKSSSHTSRGYNSLVFVPKKVPSSSAVPSMRKAPQKVVTHVCCVVAGDTVGAIRMWDVGFPNHPIWSISMGPHPVNSIVLSHSKQEIICGSQSGVVAIYDVHDVSIRAFGSKPAPLRKAILNVTEAIKPYMVHDSALFQSLTQWPGSSGIVSLWLLPQSANQIVCQLRNDWLVVLDLFKGVVVKLFTRKIELGRRRNPRNARPKAALPMSVLVAPRELEMPIATVRTSPTSWLGCHRCPATLLFDASVACWGPHGRLSVDTIDLSGRSSTLIERAKPASESSDGAADWADRNTAGDVPVGWLRLPTNGPVTAVTGHPKQHIVVWGGANMELFVLGSFGRKEDRPEAAAQDS